MLKIRGKLVDIHQRKIYGAEILVNESGIITHISSADNVPDIYIMPGFIDAHIHIESSMLVPYEFAKIALRHGTVATISDPHEIANVLGLEGVEYMIENARNAILKFHFGAPSCVPATQFETAGATIDSIAIKNLLENPDIFYLSEMMNYPGVLHNDAEVMAKLSIAKLLGKKIDGHAPGLRGESIKQYINAGISTDHECFTYEEAFEKIQLGMKVIIREGSAARNFEALHPLISKFPEMLMFCSDDKHPDELLQGHINQLVVKAISLGHDIFDILRIACLNPVEHYGMNVGTLRIAELADFIIVDNLKQFNIVATYIEGKKVADKNNSILEARYHNAPNNFKINPISNKDIVVKGSGKNTAVIIPIDGSLITEKFFTDLTSESSEVLANAENDLLKIAVVNRYIDSKPACGFIKGFGLKNCAIASTVAHDSHNIISVGCNDQLIVKAVNALIETKGGLSVATPEELHVLPLPVAGLMSTEDGESVGKAYAFIDQKVNNFGCKLKAPFMTLSFMALLVIPKIKISDQGMFDAEAFRFL